MEKNIKLPTKTSSKDDRQLCYKQLSSRGQFYTVEASPSNRAKCKACSITIQKSELRLRHVNCSTRCCRGGIDTCGLFHLACFTRNQIESPEIFIYTNPDWKPVTSINHLHGFSLLPAVDQGKVVETLGL